MEYLIYFSYLSMFLVGASKGVMDLLQFHFYDSFFDGIKNKFWNPAVSSDNKWKNGDKSQGERFLFSSTLLVWTRDGWHMVQFVMIKFIFLSVLLHTETSWLDLIGIIAFYAGFWITYESRLLRTKKNG